MRARCQASALAFTSPRSGRLAFLEHRRLEPVTLQKLVELGAIALGEQRRLRHVATGNLEEAHKIVALELLASFLERDERARILAQRALDQRRRDDVGRRERDRLLEQ